MIYRKRTMTQGQFSNLPRRLRILSSIFFQIVTRPKAPMLPPENRIKKKHVHYPSVQMVGTMEGTDGRSHGGYLMCSDLAAFQWQTQEWIQGPSMTALCLVPCFFPHTVLPLWGRWWHPEIPLVMLSIVLKSVWGTRSSLQPLLT